MNPAPEPAALLTQFEVSFRRSARDAAWDLVLTPLLLGPVCLLDNMILDNPGLITAVNDSRIRNVLVRYSRAGLLKLWHRRSHQGMPVRNMSELLMVWLSRDTREAVATIGMVSLEREDDWRRATSGGTSCLGGHANQKLREMILDFGAKRTSPLDRVAEYKRFMAVHGPNGLVEALEHYEELFFESRAASTEQWSAMPPTLQARVLRAIGAEDDLAAADRAPRSGGALAKALRESRALPKRYDNEGRGWEDLLSRATSSDSAVGAFFELLARPDDVPWGDLYSSAVDVKAECPLAGRHLPNIVTDAYVWGIPSANGKRVIWDYSAVPYQPRDVATDDDTLTRVLTSIVANWMSLEESTREMFSRRPHADEDERRRALRKHLGVLLKTMDSKVIEPPGWMQKTAKTVGGGALGAAVLLNPEVMAWVQAQEVIIGILGLSAFGVGSWAAESVLGIVYPHVPGAHGILGRHDSDAYRRGMRLIESVGVS